MEGDCILVDDLQVYVCVRGVFEDCVGAQFHSNWPLYIMSTRKRIMIRIRTEVWRPHEFFDQIWQHEEFSRGALAPIPALGHYTRFAEVYGKPVGNLHFVGTEYSDHWKGYMEGALTTGDRGSKEVVAVLGGRG